MKKIYFLFASLLILVTSCKEAIENKPQNIASQKTQIKLHKLDGGTVMVNDLQIFSQGDLYEGETKQFSDAYYVIEHPKGKLIWDTGLPNGLVGQPPFTSPDGNFTVSRTATATDQLKAIGLTPADIDYIALSHTHFDHTGAASDFSQATWIVQKDEYNFVTSDAMQKNQPDQYNAIKSLTKTKKIEGDYDVFGDGSVVIKFMPGHTPGHSVLFVDLPQSGPVLLSGDLYHFNENRTHKGIPSFNTSVADTKNSFEAFETFAKTKKAKIIIQHELKDFKATPNLMQ